MQMEAYSRPTKWELFSWLILATRDTAPVLFPDDAVKARKRLETKLTAAEVRQARAAAEGWLLKHPPKRH
jgi:hypothetical protein